MWLMCLSAGIKCLQLTNITLKKKKNQEKEKKSVYKHRRVMQIQTVQNERIN